MVKAEKYIEKKSFFYYFSLNSNRTKFLLAFFGGGFIHTVSDVLFCHHLGVNPRIT